MKIKYVDRPVIKTKYRHLLIGDIFKFNDHIFMLAECIHDDISDIYAINLTTHISCYIDDNDEVEVLKAELNVWHR